MKKKKKKSVRKIVWLRRLRSSLRNKETSTCIERRVYIV